VLKPNPLKVGDTIGVVAPSNAVNVPDVMLSADVIKKWGVKLRFGQHVSKQIAGFSAGTAQERISDLQEMLYDDKVTAIWAIDGGYAATQIMPMFSKETIALMRKRPKLFIGYSDVCLLLNALFGFGLTSIMGPNVWGFCDWDKLTQTFTRQLLFGESIHTLPPGTQWHVGVPGEAEGRLLASNLDSLMFSLGTWFDPLLADDFDLILAIEDLDVEKNLLQRQIDSLFNHKNARRIKGLIVGRYINVSEKTYRAWGKTTSVQSLIADRARAFGIPVAFCKDFGHPEWEYPPFIKIKKLFANRRFFALPNGVRSQLNVTEDNCFLHFLEGVTAPVASNHVVNSSDNDVQGSIQQRDRD